MRWKTCITGKRAVSRVKGSYQRTPSGIQGSNARSCGRVVEWSGTLNRLGPQLVAAPMILWCAVRAWAPLRYTVGTQYLSILLLSNSATVRHLTMELVGVFGEGVTSYESPGVSVYIEVPFTVQSASVCGTCSCSQVSLYALCNECVMGVARLRS